MICEGCGNDYPSTLTGCTYCGEANPEKAQPATPSKLIEFPRNPRRDAATPATPAWKQELSEKIRAVREKRGIAAPATAPLSGGLMSESAAAPARTPAAESGSPAPAARPATPRPAGPLPRRPAAAPPIENAPRPAVSATAARPQAEPVPARPRRETEVPARPALAETEPARGYAPRPTAPRPLDREATALALALEARPEPRALTEPLPRRVEVAAPKPQPAEARPAPKPETRPAPLAEAGVVDEIEPKDYLAAEVRQVQAQFACETGLPLGDHLILNVVDLLAIALSSVPFVAVAQVYEVNLHAGPTRLALGLTVLLVAVYYLGLTQALCGKTFGMMLTRARVVDAETRAPLTPMRALLRTAAYFIAVLPAAVGLLWLVTNPGRRGWQDILSGTVVTRDNQ